MRLRLLFPLALLLAACAGPQPTRAVLATPTKKLTSTRTPTPIPVVTLPASATPPKATGTPSPVPSPTDTPLPGPTDTPAAENPPYPAAPLCVDHGDLHDNSLFHTLWDSARGCHYDHEHGVSPFTGEVAAAFPGFDLKALLGGVEIGSTNPSSPLENTVKHGGMKWNVQLTHPQGCTAFESTTNGVNGSAIQYHNFGNYAVELEGRIHSTVSLLRQCNLSNPIDYGYLFVPQFQDYGQRVVPYQGTVFPYPDTPIPAYDSPSGPYLSVDCIDDVVIQCRDNREQILSRNLNTNSTWTSKPTGLGIRAVSSTVFRLLFRIRDTYQVFDWDDQVHPFTFVYICSSDGGLTYDPVGCEYNNSTTQVHEIAGEVPAAWDNLAGFDTDPRVGRITAEGYVTRFGDLNTTCTAPDTDCHPIKMVGMFVGYYGDLLIDDKLNQFSPSAQPERDIYFCAGLVCTETAPGAVPSGWIGSEN